MMCFAFPVDRWERWSYPLLQNDLGLSTRFKAGGKTSLFSGESPLVSPAANKAKVSGSSKSMASITISSWYFHRLLPSFSEQRLNFSRPKKVHLQQTIGLNCMGIILGDKHIFSILERNVICQILVTHHNQPTGSMCTLCACVLELAFSVLWFKPAHWNS